MYLIIKDMVCKIYNISVNDTNLKEDVQERTIAIHNGYYTDDKNQFPLIFTRDFFHKNPNKFIYTIRLYGSNKPSRLDFRICLNWFENQKFLWMNRSHWFQKEKNIRYVVNIGFLLFGVYCAITT